MARALQCVSVWIRAAPAPVAPSVPVTGMLREQTRGKMMPMLSWALRHRYRCSPLQPPHAWLALLLVWDQWLRPHHPLLLGERAGERPAFLQSRDHGENSCPAEWQGLSAIRPRQRGRAGFPCRLSLAGGCSTRRCAPSTPSAGSCSGCAASPA